MALIDFLESAEKITNTPAGAGNALATTDIVMAQAARTQENRMRREELQRKIDNLRKQNDELKARRESLKASTSLANLDEDKIVAIAKSKGIKDEDIDMWLRARAQRSSREISAGQKTALEAQERAMAEANRQNAEQAIYDAQADLIQAEKAVPDEQLRAQDAIVKAKRNKFERLKRDYEKTYNVPWEDVSGTYGKEDEKGGEGAQNTQEGPKNVNVELTAEQIGVLDEPTIAKYNEPTATNEEKRRIKAEADKKIREDTEAKRRREEQLDGVKTDLATIGAKSGMEAAKIVNGFDRSADRNDPVKRAAVARLKKFVGADKDFKSWKSLDNLLK